MTESLEKEMAFAYARASVSAANHHLQALRAKVQKNILMEKLFTALAFSMEIQAKRILMHLRGKIEEASAYIENERENSHDLFSKFYPRLAEGSKTHGKKSLSELFEHLAEVAKDHYDLLNTTIREEIGISAKFHICSVCGHIEVNRIPDRCPVCNAVPERFNPI